MTELEAKAKDCIENHTHKLVDKPTKQDIYLREESIYISGYKQGLKAGRPQWHKVADGDLPKDENKIVLCYVRIGYHGNIGHYVYILLTRKEFKQFMPIIAWCEIPTFDKE